MEVYFSDDEIKEVAEKDRPACRRYRSLPPHIVRSFHKAIRYSFFQRISIKNIIKIIIVYVSSSCESYNIFKINTRKQGKLSKYILPIILTIYIM